MGIHNLIDFIEVNQMSHWRHTIVDGAEFWISCKQPTFLSSFSPLQIIQNLAPSTIVWRQWNIQIPKQLVLNCKIVSHKHTYFSCFV